MRQAMAVKAGESAPLKTEPGEYLASSSVRLIVRGSNVDVFEANCCAPFTVDDEPVIVENTGLAAGVLEWWPLVVGADV